MCEHIYGYKSFVSVPSFLRSEFSARSVTPICGGSCRHVYRKKSSVVIIRTFELSHNFYLLCVSASLFSPIVSAIQPFDIVTGTVLATRTRWTSSTRMHSHTLASLEQTFVIANVQPPALLSDQLLSLLVIALTPSASSVQGPAQFSPPPDFLNACLPATSVRDAAAMTTWKRLDCPFLYLP